MTAAAIIIIAAVHCRRGPATSQPRQPRRPDAVDYAEQEERMMRAAAKRRARHD